MEEKYMIEQSGDLIQKACELAQELHKDQLRKGTKTPYFEHLSGVALLVKTAGGTNNQVAAAFLHDCLEDQRDKISPYTLEKKFGATVANIVLDCTEDKSIEEWKARKLVKLQKFRSPDLNPLSNLVALCDKLHNAESIIQDFLLCGDKVWDRFKVGAVGTVWWYTENLKIFKKHFGHNFPMVDRYENAVYLLQRMAERKNS